jgi:DNA (cytosine-5)-methyltransferase 1
VLEKLQELGYYTYITVLNALDFGVAQKRERTFIVGFNEPLRFQFPKIYGWRPHLKDILEKEETIDKKLFASDMICKKRLERLKQQGQTPFYPSMWHENKGGHIGIHPFSCALRHNASYNYLLVNGNRRPTGREMLRFQGFPESYKIVVEHTAIRAQAGNAVAVPVITAIAAEMMIALRNKTIIKPAATQSKQQMFELEEELV